MKRRQYLDAVGGIAAVSTVGLAGCLGGGSTGTLATRVSDRPGDISDFESCVVHITAIWAKPIDGDLVKNDVDEATADLVALQGDASALVGEVELETGEYEFLQLQISSVDATLNGGGRATVTVPGEAPLKFDRSFEIRADRTTTFTADFTPVKQGQSGGYVLQPVAKETTVSYEGESGTATGTTTA